MTENLMCSTHKASNKAYREGYDEIEWDDDYVKLLRQRVSQGSEHFRQLMSLNNFDAIAFKYLGIMKPSLSLPEDKRRQLLEGSWDVTEESPER